MGVNLRSYQEEISTQGANIINNLGYLYLAMQMRTGKTITTFEICRKINAKSILFITTLNNIKNVENDFNNFGHPFDLKIINYQSLHKIDDSIKRDIVVIDESHKIGQIPPYSTSREKSKSSTTGKTFVPPRDFIKNYVHKHNCKVIFLSGTPSPETYCMLYNQLRVHPNNIWKEYKTFYQWAKAGYVKVKQVWRGRMYVNDYKEANEEKILSEFHKCVIGYTGDQAGIGNVEDILLFVDMKQSTKDLIKKFIKNNGVVHSEKTNMAIIAENSAVFNSCLHQLWSGTIILTDLNEDIECKKGVIIDDSKAIYVKEYFKGRKIGIFYKFIQEYEMLKKVFGDELTKDINEFKNSNKNIAYQFVSGKEGVNLREADALVFFNMDYSATSYLQARERMNYIGREKNDVYFIFAKGGIEYEIYKIVVNTKKPFTSKHFKNYITDAKREQITI